MKLSSQGKRTPLDDQPRYSYGISWFMTAYSRLNSTRNIGLVANPISLKAIFDYLERYPPPYDENFVVDLILEVDAQLISEEAKKNG